MDAPRFVPVAYATTFPFSTAERVELISFPNRYGWDTVAHAEGTYINDVLIDPEGRVTVPKARVKDRVTLTTHQGQQLFDLLCNNPCPADEVMAAACYDPRHLITFHDKDGKAFAYIEICLECFQAHYSEGIPVQDFCPEKIRALNHLFRQLGVSYFGGPEDY